MAGSRVVYKDIALNAERDSSYTATQMDALSNLDLNNVPGTARQYTLERNRWLLDGTFTRPTTAHYLSESVSDADGRFADPPTVTVTFSSPKTSVGVTVVFDQATGEYCSELRLTWFRGSTQIAEETFHPTGVSYFCNRLVEDYDKIVFTFLRTSLPGRRARLEQLAFGLIRTFGLGEIVSASSRMESDLSSATLPAGKLDWKFHAIDDVAFMFQRRQRVDLYGNNGLICAYYINTGEQKTGNRFDVAADDALGVLASQDFPGGAYLTGVSAMALVQQIVNDAFPVSFERVTDTTLRGVLMPQNRKDALQQVLFAWGACCYADDILHVYAPGNTAKAIPHSKTYTGSSKQKNAAVTKVTVQAHTYAVDSSGSIEIAGRKYSDTTRAYTAEISVSGDNIKTTAKEVSDATLISTDNAQAAADRLLAYYQRRDTVKSKIVYDGERPGDMIQQETQWGSIETGHIQSIDVKISGLVAIDIQTVGVDV